MLRQRYFFGSLAFALAAFLIVLGLGRSASSSSSSSSSTSAPTGPQEDPLVARSDDGAFVMRLLSPQALYLFGKQRIEVSVDLPSSDAIRTVDFFLDGRLKRTVATPPFALDQDFGDEISSHSILILAQTQEGRAARLSRVSRAASPQARVEVDLVTVPVTVRDSQGKFVEGLSLSDFSLAEDDVPQTLVHFDRDPTPVALVVALDTSDSMKECFWSARKAAGDFITSLPTFYKVSVIGFNDQVTLARDFTFDRRELAYAVGRLEPSGGTALYDSLRAAATQLRGRAERRATVLFTDGGESATPDKTRGQAKLADSLQIAREAGVTFYTIAFGPQADSDLLRRIAEETGGEFFDSRDPNAFAGIYAGIAEDLNHQYTLSYYPSRPTNQGGWRRIAVRVARADATLRARPGYLAAR